MNKRQRKKTFTRAFSKAYDESLKYGAESEQIVISTIGNDRGERFLVASVMSPWTIEQHWPHDGEEIYLEGYVLDKKRLR